MGRIPTQAFPGSARNSDGTELLHALQCMWFDPSLARGVLAYWLPRKRTRRIAEQDAQPGKILHETRAVRWPSWARFRSSVTTAASTQHRFHHARRCSTYTRTGDRAFVESIWPNVERALAWIDHYGDVDGDGFVEHILASRNSVSSIKVGRTLTMRFSTPTARLPKDLIALCEVQGYVYAAKVAAAKLAKLFGDDAKARDLSKQAKTLFRRFEESFWCDELSTYALALDGRKQAL